MPLNVNPERIGITQYLGDGVYATHDGYHIVLDLRAQDPTCKIALDGGVLAALDRFKKWMEEPSDSGE